MRTDDFEDIKPQDENDPRPDRTIDIDTDESFNEFDQPASTGGNSLGEIWRNNPLIKVVVIVIGLIAVVGALVMFGGGSESPESKVGRPLEQSETPGGPTTEAYRDAVNDVNQQRLEQAMREGTSTIPIPTAGNETTDTQPVSEAPPLTMEDPLADWRASVQQPIDQQPADPQNVVLTPGSVQAGGQAVAPQPMGPDPAAVDALAQAMSAQMQTILQKHQINGPQVMSVTSADYFTRDQEGDDDVADAASDEEEVEEILVPAGTIVYAQTMTEANTDAPGPVLARISSGPLSGSRVIGTFDNTENYITLAFSQVVIKGVAYPISAVALDPKTTLPAVRSDIDHRYWKRFILPAAASFIEGMGEAISNREQVDVSVNGSTVTSSRPDLEPREEIAAGFAEGTSSIAEDIDREGDDVEPLIRVFAGTPIGILFLDPVIKQE